MAVILIRDDNRRLESDRDIAEFLAPFGIFHERWELEERVDPNAPADDILDAYQPEIDKLKAQGSYVTADVINVSPETPGGARHFRVPFERFQPLAAPFPSRMPRDRWRENNTAATAQSNCQRSRKKIPQRRCSTSLTRARWVYFIARNTRRLKIA